MIYYQSLPSHLHRSFVFINYFRYIHKHINGVCLLFMTQGILVFYTREEILYSSVDGVANSLIFILPSRPTHQTGIGRTVYLLYFPIFLTSSLPPPPPFLSLFSSLVFSVSLISSHCSSFSPFFSLQITLALFCLSSILPVLLPFRSNHPLHYSSSSFSLPYNNTCINTHTHIHTHCLVAQW